MYRKEISTVIDYIVGFLSDYVRNDSCHGLHILSIFLGGSTLTLSTAAVPLTEILHILAFLTARYG